MRGKRAQAAFQEAAATSRFGYARARFHTPEKVKTQESTAATPQPMGQENQMPSEPSEGESR